MKADSKALLKDIAITTAILVTIAVVAGAILGVVSHFTKIDPAEVLANKLSAVYESEDFGENLYNDEVSISGADGKVLGVYAPKEDKDTYIIHASGNGAYKKTIEVLIVIKDYEILKIEKYMSNETPGLGANAFTEEHTKQYLGKFEKGQQFELKKKSPNGTIDAVTAATKTSTAMNNAVNVAISYYSSMVEKGGANS